MVWGEEEEEGYSSHICSSIYQKAQILKYSKHDEYRLLVSGQAEYILREICSGPTQKKSQNI